MTEQYVSPEDKRRDKLHAVKDSLNGTRTTDGHPVTAEVIGNKVVVRVKRPERQ